MQQNVNPCVYQNPYQQLPQQSPNAVNINIIQPQAYASVPNYANCGANTNSVGYYPLYQANQNTSLPLYPMNYNNMIQYPTQAPYGYPNQAYPQQEQDGNGNLNAYNDTKLVGKTPNSTQENLNTVITTNETEESSKKNKDEKPKTITVLTDDYIKSLENYLNDSNPKIRLIGAKEVLERFKEDEGRVNNPSLTPLLNKMLRDSSPSVRFLALTTLQLGYCAGNDETVSILKEIQATNQDKLGEDALLASEILLKMTAPKMTEVK